MVEIRFNSQYEVADLAGRSVSDARKLFKDELGIPEKASARLNGKKVKGSLEVETLLGECDTLAFAQPRGKAVYMIGALLMALVITGSVFAYGYTTATTTLSVTTSDEDFASLSANASDTPSWTPHGKFKGATGSGTLFDLDTATSTYDGDLTVTVSIANGEDLVEAYRVLAMFIELRDSNNDLVDVDGDGDNDTDDYALLTLSNGAVDLYITQQAADEYVIRLKSGFYMTNVRGASGWAGKEAPILYAEVAQR